jgi:hypothetical protein
MSTTVSADFSVPVGSEKRVLATPPMVPNFSGDFDASFAPAYQAYRGVVAIEVGTGLYRDAATAVEATAAARSALTIASEAVSSSPADANFAFAYSAGIQPGAALAGEFAAAKRFGLLVPGEGLVARRSANPAPAESLLGALADAVVRGEGAAGLLLDPYLPIEQNSAAAARLLSPPAENSALLPGDASLPWESRSGAALKVDALLPIEALGSTRADSPAGSEFIAVSTTVGADILVPVGSETRVLVAPMVSDFSSDFVPDFVPVHRGMMPIEAGAGLARDTAAAAEATAAARADPASAAEALVSMPAAAKFAMANSLGVDADALLAGEFAASHQPWMILRGEWLVAQRRENTAPAESLLSALADAVVTGEGAALLFLAPVMPTEANSAAAPLSLSSPAESGALVTGDAMSPGESRSGAALLMVATLPIEALGSTPVDSSVSGESISSSHGEGLARLEWLLLSRADAAAPVAAASAWLCAAPLVAESAYRVTGDYALFAEALTAVPGDSGALLELLPLLQIDLRPPIEAAGSALRTDAALPVEILRLARGDASAAGESWGTYVVRITLTLSDGRVITFATMAMPTAAP